MAKNWMIKNGSDLVLQTMVHSDDTFDPGSPWFDITDADLLAYQTEALTVVAPALVTRLGEENYTAVSGKSAWSYLEFLELWTLSELQAIETLLRSHDGSGGSVTSDGGGSSTNTATGQTSTNGVEIQARDSLKALWRVAEAKGMCGSMFFSGFFFEIVTVTCSVLNGQGFYVDLTEKEAREAEIALGVVQENYTS